MSLINIHGNRKLIWLPRIGGRETSLAVVVTDVPLLLLPRDTFLKKLTPNPVVILIVCSALKNRQKGLFFGGKIGKKAYLQNHGA